MKYMIYIISLILLSINAHAEQEQCIDLIRYSQTKYSMYYGKNDLNNNVSKFCRLHKESRSSSQEEDYSASFKFLSGSLSNNVISSNKIYTHMCKYRHKFENNIENYKINLEKVNPNAYDTYLSCMSLKERGIRIKQKIMKNRMHILVTNDSGSSNDHTIQYNASRAIRCSWIPDNEVTINTDNSASIKPNRKASIECNRNNIDNKGWVMVYATSNTSPGVSIPWAPYFKELTRDEIIGKIDGLQNENRLLMNKIRMLLQNQDKLVNIAVRPYHLARTFNVDLTVLNVRNEHKKVAQWGFENALESASDDADMTAKQIREIHKIVN